MHGIEVTPSHATLTCMHATLTDILRQQCHADGARSCHEDVQAKEKHGNVIGGKASKRCQHRPLASREQLGLDDTSTHS